MTKKSLTNKSGQVRELTRKDIRDMQSASKVLPAELLDVLPKRKVGQREKLDTPHSFVQNFNINFFKR
jgi:hypothetical protein